MRAPPLRRLAPLLALVWAARPAPARAIYYEEESYGQESFRLLLDGGLTAPLGPGRGTHHPGAFVSAQDLIPITPNLAFGPMVGFHHFGNRVNTDIAPGLVVRDKLQVLSLAALFRLKLAPPDWHFEPFLAAGFAANRFFEEHTVTLFGQGYSLSPAAWHNGFIGQAGLDYRLDAFLFGVQGGYQTFGRALKAATGSVHFGFRFAAQP